MLVVEIDGEELVYPRTFFGHDGTKWYAISVDSDGHIHIDIETSALPSGAATEATLAEINNRIGDETSPAAGTVNKQLADAVTALQLIDDLRNALASVATDQLRADIISTVLPPGAATESTLSSLLTELQAKVWGEVVDSVVEEATGTGTGGNVIVNFSAVPTGYYYLVYCVSARQANTALSRIVFQIRRDSTVYEMEAIDNPSGGVFYTCSRNLFLKAGDILRVRFVGTTSGEALTCNLNARKIPAS